MKHSDLEPVVVVRAPDGKTTELSSKDLRSAVSDAKRNAEMGQRDRFENTQAERVEMLTETDIQKIADDCGDIAIADIQALLKRKGKEHEVAADKLQILRSAIVALVFTQLKA